MVVCHKMDDKYHKIHVKIFRSIFGSVASIPLKSWFVLNQILGSW